QPSEQEAGARRLEGEETRGEKGRGEEGRGEEGRGRRQAATRLIMYYVCVTVLIYFLPLLVMGCAYLVVGLTLWASNIPGDSSDRYKEQLTAKRKVVKMMIVVVCTFAICWLPYHVYFLLHLFSPLLFETLYIQQVYLAVMFRAGFKQAFRCCPCVPAGSYEGLELKSTRYLQTQTSMYKASRMETTVSTVPHVADDLEPPRFGALSGAGCEAGARGVGGGGVGLCAVAAPRRSSLDLTSNGSSSRSVSKTVSETSSFYNNLPE
ncbi:unnamed protein product, partial [Coregonus sp. 'balchen']